MVVGALGPSRPHPGERTATPFRQVLAALLLAGLIAAGPRPGLAAPGASSPIEQPAPDGTAEPFGEVAAEPVEGPILDKWAGIQRAFAAEAALLDLCRAAPTLCPAPAALEFLAIVDQASGLTGLARAGEINRAVNLDIRPASDLERFQAEDVWSSPLATLTARAGDCEDYAIAKYAALRAAGIGASDVRLVILRDAAGREDHAVTAVRIEGRWRILDNRGFVMAEDRDLRRWRPLFVLSEAGVRRYPDEPVVAAAPTQPQPQPYL